MNQNKKYLFAIDLDGTLLSSSIDNTIHPLTIKGIKRAIKEGCSSALQSSLLPHPSASPLPA